MPSIKLDDHSTLQPSFVDLVSDDDEGWKCWNIPSEWKKSSTDQLDSPAMRSLAESDPACSIAASEPLAKNDGLPHTKQPGQVSEGSKAIILNTSAGGSPTNRPIHNVFGVADNSDDARAVPDIPLSPTQQGNASQTSSTLPSPVRAVLDRWYAREGRREPPPCAVRKFASHTLNTTFTGGPVTYVHWSGEVLEVELYALPEFSDSDHAKKHIIVAAGDTRGPFIIAYKDTKTAGESFRSMRYLIWEGVDSRDKDGWEEQPSIWKIPKPRSEGTNPHSDVAANSSTLPVPIRSLLDEWYAREGHQRPLPCATTVSKKGSLHCDYKGRPAIYTHNNGEVLTVDMFPLPMFGDIKVEQKYVVVACGASLGSLILGYLRSKADGKGSHVTEYRIWKGTHSQDPNGWDESVLVEKRLKARLPTNSGKVGRALKPSMPSSRPPVAQKISQANPGYDPDILEIPSSSPIPSKTRRLINEWCLLQGPGHALPFVTRIKDPHFASSYAGTPAYFKHDNGTILDVALYPLGSQRPQDQGCNLIIAQGRGSGPFLIMKSHTGEGRGCSKCVYYYTWIGANGDTDGFAYEFTIAKYFAKVPQIKDKDTLSSHVPLHMRRSANAPSTQSPSKRRRLDTSTDGSLKSSFSLNDHVRNNAVLLSFSANNKTPRVSLLSTCDSAQKLFARALAGDLFHESRMGPNILSVKIAGQQKAYKVVEGDEDDFESLLTAITRLSCWHIVGDKIDGSCTVEVRAVS